MNGHTNYVKSVAISPDNKKIVSGSSDKTIRTWDLESGNLINTLNGYGEVLSVAISSDNKKIVSGSGDKTDHTIRIWDIYERGLYTKPASRDKKY